MTKQTDKKAKELSKAREEKEEEESADEDESEDEEQGEGDDSDADESDQDDSDESEEEDDEAASAKPAAGKSGRASREDDEAEEEEEEGEAEDEDDEQEEEAEAPADPEDPYWWAPHAVLGALVLIGVLGFFGVFNKALGFLASKRTPAAAETPAAAPAPPKPAARPLQPPSQPMPPAAPAEMFGAKHVLVMYKGGRRAPPNVTRTKEEAKARAEEALKKAKSGKVKFEDLVAEYSDEPNAAQRGGDLGQFAKGQMVPEFQAGLEKTKVGEISDMVETPFGYHIILRTK